MIGEYSCSYILNSGEMCARPCIRPEGCRFHWKSKKRIPCTDCGKPTGSTSGRCPFHIRGYYVTQYYNKLRSNIRERAYEEIMDVYKDTLAILNITLCRECFHLIKLEEGEYCNSCQPE